MAKRQINIRGVPESVYEWIERERHAKRVSQKEFLLKVLENCAAHSPADAGAAGASAFSRMTMVYWKSKKFWLGKLLEHPEIMTQGRTLEELERNIREAYMLMALDEVPANYQVREVTMA
ncbi:MAG: type II toxin-antitoxin system HicB family antitoxin [Candidatus Brocadiia bacterium]